MPRKITVGIAFEFYPDTDDIHLFRTSTGEQQVSLALYMASKDIARFVESQSLVEALYTEVEGEAGN